MSQRGLPSGIERQRIAFALGIITKGDFHSEKRPALIAALARC